MKPLHSFRVDRTIPKTLAPLTQVANNLRWSWDRQSQDLFRWIDPKLWEETDQNAFHLLELVSQDRLVELAEDSRFTEFLKKVASDLEIYMKSESWFQNRTSPLVKVAYFSPEFGISSALPQYSGGLGVLAGDHLKSSSALGVPIVGVGLFYRSGYFRQGVTPRGNQFERYPNLNPLEVGLEPAFPIDEIGVRLADDEAVVKIWRAKVGRVELYLLDTDHDHNPPHLRAITDRLYGGDVEHRLRQEIVLGIGGVRALRALDIEVSTYHSNEGHAGFLGLERLRELVSEGLSFKEAIEVVRASNIFTTHTPVPAGIDQFPVDLMRKYLGYMAQDCKVEESDVLSLGHFEGESLEAPFNMAVMGMRLASFVNGVSQLHGEVSRELFAGVWPQLEKSQVPIGHVTNGVHPSTWTAHELADLYSSNVHPNWANASSSEWSSFMEVPDELLWQVKEGLRSKMVPEIRRRLKTSLIASGWEEVNLGWCDSVLDSKTLTVGFARRFAPYKRADLLLSQTERLLELCLSIDRPVQFIFAGKAHPKDEPGKEIVRKVFDFAFNSQARSRFVFVPDYDMSLAKVLYQGCDIWLNTPTRPLEASGTSGMKAALNGALNLSILDGWWAEMYDGLNGWAIASAPAEFYEDERSRLECDSLFSILENQAVPEFYDRDLDQTPRRWTARMKHSISTLAPKVSGHRMVSDYVSKFYEPAATRSQSLCEDGFERAKQLAKWKEHVRNNWSSVAVSEVEIVENVDVDGQLDTLVRVSVSPGALGAQDLTVSVLWGKVGRDGELVDEFKEKAELVAVAPEVGTSVFECHLKVQGQGTFGMVTSVLPAHDGLSSPYELGLQIIA
ncbi:starch phosphorylase [Ferrithrix thermotolerans DSM 19514]|uniref:glycogen phosphorylase n=1 Tax=Ferrithrix thermotolerans DSM 19514 TaxID=1121881 RepID=A0A1M4XWT8_9ACTN|nr:alpha-glucan family phosphorylase [Ferrithrix thermotolerans]SHE97816.1 starch phosphorylase [Ferrithrix thermotolerans DSM 19514]